MEKTSSMWETQATGILGIWSRYLRMRETKKNGGGIVGDGEGSGKADSLCWSLDMEKTDWGLRWTVLKEKSLAMRRTLCAEISRSLPRPLRWTKTCSYVSLHNTSIKSHIPDLICNGWGAVLKYWQIVWHYPWQILGMILEMAFHASFKIKLAFWQRFTLCFPQSANWDHFT